jgi:hypothetical protein
MKKRHLVLGQIQLLLLLLLLKLENEAVRIITTWPSVSTPIRWTSTYWGEDHSPTVVFLQCIQYCAQFLHQLKIHAVHWQSLHRHRWNTYKWNMSDTRHYTVVLNRAKVTVQQPHARQHTARWHINLILYNWLYLMNCRSTHLRR